MSIFGHWSAQFSIILAWMPRWHLTYIWLSLNIKVNTVDKHLLFRVLTWFAGSWGKWSIAICCLVDSRGWRRHGGWGGPGLGFHIRRWIWHCANLMHSTTCNMKGGQGEENKQSSRCTSCMKKTYIPSGDTLVKEECTDIFTWETFDFLPHKPKDP